MTVAADSTILSFVTRGNDETTHDIEMIGGKSSLSNNLSKAAKNINTRIPSKH